MTFCYRIHSAYFKLNPSNDRYWHLFSWFAKLKLLKKPAGQDKIKPVILQELSFELVPILKVLFECSIESGAVPHKWNSANVSPICKRSTNQLLPIIGQFLLHAASVNVLQGT